MRPRLKITGIILWLGDHALRAPALLIDLKTVTGKSISRWNSFFKPQSHCFTLEQERGGDALLPCLTQTGDTQTEMNLSLKQHMARIVFLSITEKILILFNTVTVNIPHVIAAYVHV